MMASSLKGFFVVGVLGALWALPGIAQVSDDDRGKLAALPRLFEALGAKPGVRIADVGSGDGFYSLQISKVVTPGGRVTASDIDKEGLDRLRKRIESEKVTNVDVMMGRPDDPLLESNAYDAVLIRNAYHEMTEHEAMLRHIHDALKPGGRFVVTERMLESRRGLSRQEQVAVHQIASEFVAAELLAAGFQIQQRDESFEPSTDPQNPGGLWLIMAVKSREQ